MKKLNIILLIIMLLSSMMSCAKHNNQIITIIDSEGTVIVEDFPFYFVLSSLKTTNGFFKGGLPVTIRLSYADSNGKRKDTGWRDIKGLSYKTEPLVY